MYRTYESFTQTETLEKNTRIIEYSGIVDTVQLTVARLLDVEGSIDAQTFSEILIARPEEERERLICEIGGQFDEALISFVITALIGRRNQHVIIKAEASEGINGGLPWEPKLQQHIQKLQANGLLRGASLEVERYTPDTRAIDLLTEQAQALAA